MKESVGERLKIFFITRKFPPTLGGMERVAYELYVHLSQIVHVELLKWGGSNKYLPLILPYFFIKACWILFKKNMDVLYLQDGLLSPLGLILKKIFKKPTMITIHGLDITYNNWIYQSLIPKCVSKLDKIICISNATKKQCINRNIPENKIVVIPNGVSNKFYINEDKKTLRRKLSKKLGINLKNRKIILSAGRLIKRKGFHWFIKYVLPKIITESNDIIYLIVGDGRLRNKIKSYINEVTLEKYAVLLGRVSDDTLKLLYNSADLLLMPNIHVEGDLEGFGIVGLEAGSCGLPIIVSNIEGMRDFVENEINGFLVEPKDIEGIAEKVLELLKNQELRRKFSENALETSKKYDWNIIVGRYNEIFEEISVL